jgi:hypothetical protein
MRPKEDIEKFVKVRKPHVTTSREMDKRTMDDSFTAMEQTIRAKSAGHKPSTARIVPLSRMVKLTAAAAVIIVAVGLFLGRDRNTPRKPTARPRTVAESTIKKMSLMSLRMAYRRGGFDALDRQFRDTLDVLGPQSLSISMQQLLESVNGF